MLQTIEVHRHEAAGPEHYTSYWQIHNNKVHEVSLAMVVGLGGDVIASRVLRMSRYLGDTDSQSEKA